MLWTLDIKAHRRSSTVDCHTQTQAWEGRQRTWSHHCTRGVHCVPGHLLMQGHTWCPVLCAGELL